LVIILVGDAVSPTSPICGKSLKRACSAERVTPISLIVSKKNWLNRISLTPLSRGVVMQIDHMSCVVASFSGVTQ